MPARRSARSNTAGQAGSLGIAGCFSFFPSKNLGAFGDAGLVTTNDDALAHELRLLRNHGAEPKYFHSRIGGNFRLDALQAAVLRVKLPYLGEWTEARRANARRYDELFAAAGISGLSCCRPKPRAIGTSSISTSCACRDRDRVRSYMTEHGIGTEIYYPVPFHLQECFAPLGYSQGDFPHSEAAANSTMALPIYGELTLEQQQAVVATLGEALTA